MVIKDQDPKDWLNREDTLSFNDRLKRLEWINSNYPVINFQLFAGLGGKYLFEETRYCYVYGQYLASIVLGLAFIERSLAAAFYAQGRNDLERKNLFVLLENAVQNRLISEEEFTKLEEIRKKRNAIAHFRKPGHRENIETRAVEGDELPYAIIEEDAKVVMLVIYQLLEKWPFSV